MVVVLRNHMRSVADRYAAVQVFVNQHGLPGERVAPARFFQLKDSILHRNRVVLIHRTFVRSRRSDLDWIFSVQHERTVNQDNTISVENRVFQLEKTRWRNTLAGQTVIVHEHLDGRVSIRYGPHVIAQYANHQLPPQAPKRRGRPRLPIAREAA